MFKNYLRSLTLALAIFSLSGCGIIDMIYLPPAEDTAQEIFEAGNDAMSEKNYVRAVELYNKLRDTYPFSPYTVDAELALADAYYLDEEYVLAAETYKDFESLHPRHEATPYVIYQTGMSLMKQFRSIDRATRSCRKPTNTSHGCGRSIPTLPMPRMPRKRCIPAVV